MLYHQPINQSNGSSTTSPLVSLTWCKPRRGLGLNHVTVASWWRQRDGRWGSPGTVTHVLFPTDQWASFQVMTCQRQETRVTGECVLNTVELVHNVLAHQTREHALHERLPVQKGHKVTHRPRDQATVLHCPYGYLRHATCDTWHSNCCSYYRLNYVTD